MLERRKTHRRRVCHEAHLTAGMHSPITSVRVRNVTPFGAEIVAPSGRIDALPLHVRLAKEEAAREARIVWRRMDRFGLEFVTESGGAAPAAGDAPSHFRHDSMPSALRRRFETILDRASRSA